MGGRLAGRAKHSLEAGKYTVSREGQLRNGGRSDGVVGGSEDHRDDVLKERVGDDPPPRWDPAYGRIVS